MAARPRTATLVVDQFGAEDFHLIVDDRADAHVSSKGGHFYLGWFPLGRPGIEGVGWKIAVIGTDKVAGYEMSFAPETPCGRPRVAYDPANPLVARARQVG